VHKLFGRHHVSETGVSSEHRNCGGHIHAVFTRNEPQARVSGMSSATFLRADREVTRIVKRLKDRRSNHSRKSTDGAWQMAPERFHPETVP
jgi:hypothetical protein